MAIQFDVTRFKTLVESVMPETLTLERQNLQIKGRVSDGKGEVRVNGLPPMVRLRRWKLYIPETDDGGNPVNVRAGDRIDATSTRTGLFMGQYYVTDMGSPASYRPWQEAYCVLLQNPDGTPNFPTNETVTFDNLVNNLHLPNIGVLVYPAGHDAQVYPTALRYEWAVWVPQGTAYPNTTTLVDNGDVMSWTHFQRAQSIAERRPILNPIPATCFYVSPVNDQQR